MATLRKILSLSGPHKRSGKLTIPLLVLLTACSISRPAEAKYGPGNDTTASTETSTYVFVFDQSTVVQTGGFMGVHETYGIEGQFQLTVDYDAGTASFDTVDANLTEPSQFLYTESLGVLFNMTELRGAIIGDKAIRFKGETSDNDGTKILITLTFTGDSVHLTGETIPPPGSADFFEFDLDAVAQKKYDTPAPAETSMYVFLPDQSTVVQTGGFAGVHETYGIEGQFQLSVDYDAGTASFDKVDANMTEPSGFLYTESLGVLFNMTELRGTIIDDKAIEFKGKTSDNDGSKILITLTFTGDSVHLRGETIPPPGSADFFEFDLDAVAQKKYDGGIGESNCPYLIYTAEQMNTIGTDPNDWEKHFKLMADIDLSEYTGTDFNIIGTHYGRAFAGVFDGNGHKISNFTYVSTEERPVGLFRHVGYGGKIKDLGLSDPNIVAESSTGVGALVGWLAGGSLSSCYVQDGKVMGYDSVGGLIGDNGGTVNSCYSTANVSGNNRVGGLVGANWMSSLYGVGIIRNCYAAGKVMGTTDVGGLAGHNNSLIRNSFWDIETSGLSESSGGTGKTTVEMQMESTFTDAGWDFVEIWGIGENQTYPYLRLYPAGDLNHDGRVDFLDLAELAAHWLEDNSL